MRVLVADGSPLIRERMVALLEDLPGLDVIAQTTDAVRLLHVVQSLQPDVVLLDFHLVEASGLELVRRLKRAQPRGILIVLVSQTPEAYRPRCLEAGADHVFDKSFEFQTVRRILRSWLQQRAPGSTRGRLPA